MLRLVLGVSDDGEAGKCKALKDTMYRKKFKFFYLHLPTFGYRWHPECERGSVSADVAVPSGSPPSVVGTPQHGRGSGAPPDGVGSRSTPPGPCLPRRVHPPDSGYIAAGSWRSARGTANLPTSQYSLYEKKSCSSLQDFYVARMKSLGHWVTRSHGTLRLNSNQFNSPVVEEWMHLNFNLKLAEHTKRISPKISS